MFQQCVDSSEGAGVDEGCQSADADEGESREHAVGRWVAEVGVAEAQVSGHTMSSNPMLTAETLVEQRRAVSYHFSVQCYFHTDFVLASRAIRNTVPFERIAAHFVAIMAPVALQSVHTTWLKQQTADEQSRKGQNRTTSNHCTSSSG